MKLNFKFTYQTPSIRFPVGIIRIDNHQLLDKIISHFVREVPHSSDSACSRIDQNMYVQLFHWRIKDSPNRSGDNCFAKPLEISYTYNLTGILSIKRFLEKNEAARKTLLSIVMNSPRLPCYRKGLGKAHIKFLPWSSGPGETSTLRGRLRPWRRGARRNGCIRRLISKQLFISQKRLFPIPAFPASEKNTFGVTLIVRCAKKYFLTLADTTDSPNTTITNKAFSSCCILVFGNGLSFFFVYYYYYYFICHTMIENELQII